MTEGGVVARLKDGRGHHDDEGGCRVGTVVIVQHELCGEGIG